ncbi:hypothetical protein ACJ72_07778, partial [Emergomyces africanus]
MSPIADKEVKNAPAESKGHIATKNGISTGDTEPRVETSDPQVQPENGNSPGPSGTESRSARQHRASVGRRVTARPHASSSSLNSLSSQIHSLSLGPAIQDDEPAIRLRNSEENPYAQHSLLAQVRDWLQHEKSKSTARTLRRTGASHAPLPDTTARDTAYVLNRDRSDSQASEGMLALEKLEQILEQYAANGKGGSSPATIGRKSSSSSLKRRSGIRGLRRGSTSDSDYSDADQPPPSADVVLDNSKTLLYGGGEADNDLGNQGVLSGASAKNKEHWL